MPPWRGCLSHTDDAGFPKKQVGFQPCLMGLANLDLQRELRNIGGLARRPIDQISGQIV